MTSIRRLKPEDHFDNWLISQEAFFTQGEAFANWQRAAGRTIIREIISKSKTDLYFQAIKYPLPFGLSYLYIPHGPVCSEKPNANLLKIFHQRLREICRDERAVFVRFDPWPTSSAQSLSSLGSTTPTYALHSAFLQPGTEWLIDLQPEITEIFSKLDKKTRYAIRRAQQGEVRIEIITDNLATHDDAFYHLLETTARRGGFTLHPRSYYNALLRITDERKDGFLVLARYREEIIVANLIHIFGSRALYVFSGSSDKQRELSAPYLAQWATIEELKRRGIETYSLGGVAEPSDKQSAWQGLSRFKRHFPGRDFHFSPSRDIVIKPFWYYLYILRKWLKK